MIKKPTVFILGAGASIPYGYPSGENLVREIVNDLSRPGSLFYSLCRELGFTEPHILEFVSTLDRSHDKSIDAFLQRNESFIKLGKVAITLKLIVHEDETVLFSPGDDKWYRDLVSELKSPSLDSFDNAVAFLTFNYDRSFEHYLYVSIQNSYEELKQSPGQCDEIVNRIPIIHLHGQIGKLPWQDNTVTRRDYGSSFKELDLLKRSIESRNDVFSAATLDEAKHYIFSLSEQIKIMHENELDSDFEEANKLLTSARNIYFLGFAYHDENLRRLDLSALPPISQALDQSNEVNIDGTAYGIGAAKRRHVETITNGKIKMSDKNYKVKEFLREKVDFE